MPGNVQFIIIRQYVRIQVCLREAYDIKCVNAIVSNLSVTRQKGESQMEVIRKQNKPNVSKNEHFLPPDTHTYLCVLEDKKCLLFKKFGVLCFLVTSVLRFSLLPYYRRIND